MPHTEIDKKGLSLLTNEVTPLSLKPHLTKAEERRFNALLSQISAVKAGATLEEAEHEYHNEESRRMGFSTIPFKRSAFSREKVAELRGWQQLANIGTKQEYRDMLEGSPMIAQLGTYSNLGYFVPTDFFNNVFMAMKAHDCLFDDESVTMIRSSNGRPMPVPVAGDSENEATIVGETDDDTSTDIYSTGHAVLGAYNYRSRKLIVSLEAFEDLEGTLSVLQLFTKVAADGLARGIGKDLVNGNGSGKTLGLIDSLNNVGAIVISAQGSAGNDGSAATGVTSLGTVDFANAFRAIDAAYLASPKVKWLMNMKTFGTLLNLSDKQGRPIHLIQYQNGSPTIYGVKIGICPSMDQIGASNVPVVLGDLSYWATRLIVDDLAGVRVFKESAGLIENGNIGLRSYMRADGALLYNDSDSPCPFVMIRNHS